MSTFKEGDTWRHNEPTQSVKYFDCRLREIIDNKPGLSVTKLARILNKSCASVSEWINGHTIPPSYIQEQIALLLGCKNRAEIWRWKGNKLTRHLLKMNRLHEELEEIETMIQIVLSGGA